jgi:hypothetical protein
VDPAQRARLLAPATADRLEPGPIERVSASVALSSVPATATLAPMTVVHHRGTVPATAAGPVMTAAMGAQYEPAPEDHGDDEDGRGDGDGRCGHPIDPGVSVAPTPALRRFCGPRCYCVRFGGGFGCVLRCFSHAASLTSRSG